jgi:hypothetical protein
MNIIYFIDTHTYTYTSQTILCNSNINYLFPFLLEQSKYIQFSIVTPIQIFSPTHIPIDTKSCFPLGGPSLLVKLDVNAFSKKV